MREIFTFSRHENPGNDLQAGLYYRISWCTRQREQLAKFFSYHDHLHLVVEVLDTTTKDPGIAQQISLDYPERYDDSLHIESYVPGYEPGFSLHLHVDDGSEENAWVGHEYKLRTTKCKAPYTGNVYTITMGVKDQDSAPRQTSPLERLRRILRPQVPSVALKNLAWAQNAYGTGDWELWEMIYESQYANTDGEASMPPNRLIGKCDARRGTMLLGVDYGSAFDEAVFRTWIWVMGFEKFNINIGSS